MLRTAILATGMPALLLLQSGDAVHAAEIAQANHPASIQDWLQQERNNPNLQKSRERFLRSLPPPTQNFISQRPIPAQAAPRVPVQVAPRFPVQAAPRIPVQAAPRIDPIERDQQYDFGIPTEPEIRLGRLYFGGHLGYGLAAYDGSYTDGTDTVVIDGFSAEGFDGGFHAGIGGIFKGIYLGGEAEYAYGNMETFTRLNFSTVKLTRDHSYMATGRVGYHIVRNTLGYLKFGVAHSRWSTVSSNGIDGTSWLPGVAFGAGMDYSPADSFSIRGEILGIKYLKFVETLGFESIQFNPSVYSFRIGLDYQL